MPQERAEREAKLNEPLMTKGLSRSGCAVRLVSITLCVGDPAEAVVVGEYSKATSSSLA